MNNKSLNNNFSERTLNIYQIYTPAAKQNLFSYPYVQYTSIAAMGDKTCVFIYVDEIFIVYLEK